MSIITTAIGLILVYLILSLIISSLQETIANWFSLRGKHLGHALDQMLTNEKTTEGSLELDKSLLEKFQSHPSYRDLVINKRAKGAGKSNHPSYMNAATFSAILMHILDASDIKSISAAVDKMEEGQLKSFLLDSLDEAGKDLSAFRTNLENWYDRVMSRVSGWYKRFSHNLILVLGLLLAGYMNADTLTIYAKMSSYAAGSPQEQEVLNLAQGFVDSRYDAYNQHISDINASLDSFKLDTAKYAEQVLIANRALLTQVDSLIVTVNGDSALGLGWTEAEWQALKTGGVMGWLNKLFGLLITALAISLGAPFWFDMLKKIINIRNAGPIHQDSATKGPANKTTT